MSEEAKNRIKAAQQKRWADLRASQASAPEPEAKPTTEEPADTGFTTPEPEPIPEAKPEEVPTAPARSSKGRRVH